jgi:hypothetical protein
MANPEYQVADHKSAFSALCPPLARLRAAAAHLRAASDRLQRRGWERKFPSADRVLRDIEAVGGVK